MLTRLRTIGSTWKTAIALAALCLLLAGGGGIARQALAQDAASTANSPIVGVWVAPPRGEESGSITSFSADGSLVDHETDGAAALGAWEATGPTSAIATFVFFANEDDFTGTSTIRATLEYDQATDSITASYSGSAALPDGTVVWTSEELITATLTRLPVQGPEMAGASIGGSSMVHIPPPPKEER
jgi:hypothetical protein